jgi:hypothetical protein
LPIDADASAVAVVILLTMTADVRLLLRLPLLLVIASGEAVGCGGTTSDSSCDKDDGNCFARNMKLAENGVELSTVDVGTPCNTVVSLGTDVVSMSIPGTAAPPAGGTLSDGFYILTKREQFTGSAAAPPSSPSSTNTRSETLFVSNRGSTMQFVRRETGGTTARGNRLLSVSGSKMTIEEKCPKTSTSSADFSVIGTSIVVYESATILNTFSISPTPPSARPAITNKPPPITLTGTTKTLVEVTTTSPWQCRPVLCFGTLVKTGGALTAGIQSRTSACVAAPKGSAPGPVKIDVRYAVPSRSPPQALGLQIFPVSAPDCATTDVLSRLANGDSAVVYGEAVVVDQTINGP